MTSQTLLRMALRRAVTARSFALVSATSTTASAALSRTARTALFAGTTRLKSTAAIEEEEEEVDSLHSNETFLNGTGSLYAEQMYDAWIADPNSVHETWRTYFENLENGVAYDETQYSNPSVVPGTGAVAKQQGGALAVR